MLNNTHQFKLNKIVNAIGNRFNDLQKQIFTNFIVDAIQCVYFTMVNNIFNFNANIKYLYIPTVDIFLYGRTKHITLKPILNNKVFINNNYRIMENIFLEQLQYNHETAFND